MLSCVVIWVRGRTASAARAELDSAKSLRVFAIPYLAALLLLTLSAAAGAQTPGRDAPSTWGSGKPRAAPPAPTAGDDEDEDEDDDELEDVDPLPPGALARRREPASDVEDQALRYTLEAVEIRGNTRTRDRVVLRYIPFHVGDILDVEDPSIELTRYRLLGTGFFRDVQFSLRKGSAGGKVILVIEVIERNTFVVNDLWMGLSKDADNEGTPKPLTPYAGLDAAETNLAGTGILLGGAIGLASNQLALRVRFLDPAFLGSTWMTGGELLFNDARDFFGNSDVRYVAPAQDTERVTEHATVQYKRFGGALGVGRDLSISTQLWLHYRLESIDATPPDAASHIRGDTREPIDFDIIPGRSVLSTLRATLEHDTRDQPVLPSRGWFLQAMTEVSLAPAGSDYPYERFELKLSKWWELPWDHVISLSLFGGAISGDAPFFEQYYVGDFSDFLPARVLGLNFDRRPPPNLLGTAIQEVRYGRYAGRISSEYRIPLYRGSRSVYGIDFFASAGVYAVANPVDFDRPASGYSGLARAPIDVTGNLGFRIDTSAGGFAFAFSNALGFIPPIQGENP